jgi:hypothetical protein
MSLLPRATLHSDSEQLVFVISSVGVVMDKAQAVCDRCLCFSTNYG